ncbi:putative J domain-containing protein C63.13 [Erysiphe neolycopersici]|uniref:Putative J domain-containing protein C63.13 n=1 Tax=Erysiphe neolycopersici TaxID=212602 RepID=A0A420HBF5_9PEZI|nr:putative J domain-containing protein C63.13 [Erysiphe neolycopersici]
MLRDEGLAGDENMPTGRFWSIVGGFSGATMGFIVANFSGLIAGAAVGNRLGAVRDKKGKSVYEAFQELPASDKAKLLSLIASKVLSHSMGL